MSVSRILRFSVIFVIMALAAPVTVGAATRAPTFSIRPVQAQHGYFVLETTGGQQLHRTARIVNTGTKRGTVFVYPVDAATGATSGAVYLDRERPRRSVGAWIRLPVSRLVLGPGEKRLLPFTVSVPRGARAGDHLGGIVVENAELTGSSGGAGGPRGLRVHIRKLSIVAVHVVTPGGRRPAIEFGGVTAGGSGGFQTLFFALRNPGNVLLKPTLDFAVSDCQGNRLQAGTRTLDTFVPQTAIRYPVAVRDRALDAGFHCVSGTLRYAGRKTPFVSRFEITREQVDRVFTAPTPLAAPERDPTSVAEILRNIARISVAVGERAVFPSLLLLLLVLFLIVQDRIDRRDPKLALAPVRPVPDLQFAAPPTEGDE